MEFMQHLRLTAVTAGKHSAINLFINLQRTMPEISYIPADQALPFLILDSETNPALDRPEGILDYFGEKIDIPVTHPDSQDKNLRDTEKPEHIEQFRVPGSQ
jgi:hypothetical protein